MLLAAPPPLMLWAWERPADLRGLPASAGVAFLAATVKLGGGEASVTPRFQPLKISPGTYRMAVIRIEGPAAGVKPAAVTEAALDTVRATEPDGLQIDFDARASERVFYATLLRDLRARYAGFLSITALVSWCGARSWLEKLPVNEVVPMAFEMGASAGAAETLLGSGGQFESAACRGSIGIDARDMARRPKRQRTYVFPYQDWDAALVRAVLGSRP